MDLILGIARPEKGRATKARQKAPVQRGSSASGDKNPSAHMIAKHIDKDLKEKILKRDGHTCQYCQFEAQKYQNIHHLDNNLKNFDENNLVTACVFCHQCFHLDHVGDMESGSLIWLPEIDQKTLHHIARAIYVGRIAQGEIAEAARKAYDVLLGRSEEAANRLGSDNPTILATVLKDYLSPKAYAMRKRKLEGIRLWPRDKRQVQDGGLSFNQFPQILAYWRSKNGPFGGKTPAQWISVTEDILRKSAA